MLLGLMRQTFALCLGLALFAGCGEEPNVPVNDPYVIPETKKRVANETKTADPQGSAAIIGYTILDMRTQKFISSGIVRLKAVDILVREGRWAGGGKIAKIVVPFEKGYSLAFNLGEDLTGGSLVALGPDYETEWFTWLDGQNGMLQERKGGGRLRVTIEDGKLKGLEILEMCHAQLYPPGMSTNPAAVDVQIEIYPGSFIKLP